MHKMYLELYHKHYWLLYEVVENG